MKDLHDLTVQFLEDERIRKLSTKRFKACILNLSLLFVLIIGLDTGFKTQSFTESVISLSVSFIIILILVGRWLRK